MPGASVSIAPFSSIAAIVPVTCRRKQSQHKMRTLLPVACLQSSDVIGTRLAPGWHGQRNAMSIHEQKPVVTFCPADSSS